MRAHPDLPRVRMRVNVFHLRAGTEHVCALSGLPSMPIKVGAMNLQISEVEPLNAAARALLSPVRAVRAVGNHDQD